MAYGVMQKHCLITLCLTLASFQTGNNLEIQSNIYKLMSKNHVYNGPIISSHASRSLQHCATICLRHDDCNSFNICDNGLSCELTNSTSTAGYMLSLSQKTLCDAFLEVRLYINYFYLKKSNIQIYLCFGL